MATTPMPPPEAEALRIARIRQHLSIREAAQRAGVSVSLWRQVEAGYMTPVKGVHAPKIAPAATLARMARAVDLQAEHLESGGQRPDAAEILREMERQAPASPLQIQALPSLDRTGESFSLTQDMAVKMAPHVAEIEGRLAVWARSAVQLRGDAAIGEIPDGATVFPDRPLDAERWDALIKQGFLGERYTLWQLVQGIAILRVRDEERRQDSGNVGVGLAHSYL